MTRATIAGGAFVAALAILLVVLLVRAPAPVPEQDVASTLVTAPAVTPSEPAAAPPADQPGFIYGRVTDVDGATYEGRLRWGRDQEAFWGDYFNGIKSENPWAAHAPREWRSPIEIFGIAIGESPVDLGRQFLARFGDLARLDAHVRSVQVTLKSGTVVELDRFAAGDIDDGVRVWDGRRGVVDLDDGSIRTIEFLASPPLAGAARRLHGTVRTRQGDFTGLVEWDQQDGVGADELDGRSATGELHLRFDTIRAITRQSRDSAMVTLLDGREMVLAGTRDVGQGNRGIYVDDGRYGRVLVSWDAFERVDFSLAGSAPAYGDFPPGRALAGSLTTRDGRRLTGRLVYDFDESEITETLDAASQGVDYNIPFGLIASIVAPGHGGRGAPHATVTLHSGEQLQFERSGDLGDRNAGLLVFAAGRERPEYVPWTDVEQVDFDRVPAIYPPPGGR